MIRDSLHRVRLVLLLTAALSLGLHFALVQVVGWVNMTVDYSQRAPLSEALRMTFDGKHPCKLCKLVERELAQRDQDQNPAPDHTPALKLPPVVCWIDEIRLIHRPHLFLHFTTSEDRAHPRRDRPPLPPPREVIFLIS